MILASDTRHNLLTTSSKAVWRKTSIQGLYERLPSGVFYSRFRVNGKQTFRTLETNVFEHAKLKHAERGTDVEKDRQRGANL